MKTPLKYRMQNRKQGYQIQGLFVWEYRFDWKRFKLVPKVLAWQALDAQGNTGKKAENTFFRNQAMAWQVLRRIKHIHSIR